MNHAYQRAGEVVDESQRLVPQPELDPPCIDQSLALQQHQPRVRAHQQRRPERQQHEDHAKVGRALRHLRQQVRERITDDDADHRRQRADLECHQERPVVRRLLDHPAVMLERQRSVVGEERQREQPADRKQHHDCHQDESRRGEAEQCEALARLIAAQAGGVGARVGCRHVASAGNSTVSSIAMANRTRSPDRGADARAALLAMPRTPIR